MVDNRARVLIVDDTWVVRELCRNVLISSGHEILEAENGQQALSVYRDQRPDAVLLDINMPVADGLTVLSWIRELDPEARVAMLTASRENDQVMRALALGASDYVIKPFRGKRLREAVDRLLARSVELTREGQGVA